jgi:hypothetical protein
MRSCKEREGSHVVVHKKFDEIVVDGTLMVVVVPNRMFQFETERHEAEGEECRVVKIESVMMRVVTERKIDQRNVRVLWATIMMLIVPSTCKPASRISMRCPRPGKAANTPDAMLHDDACLQHRNPGNRPGVQTLAGEVC